jgi:hypothetical protein
MTKCCTHNKPSLYIVVVVACGEVAEMSGIFDLHRWLDVCPTMLLPWTRRS